MVKKNLGIFWLGIVSIFINWRSKFNINNINVLHLTDVQIRARSSINRKRINHVIFLIPNNIVPGLDGFPAEFYKLFWDMLSPIYLKCIQGIKQTGIIPCDLNTAAITVLLKPCRDPTVTCSYWSLSLMNTDMKIITKAVTIRIEKVISSIIHLDQTGFIKHRHSPNNTPRLLNLTASTGSR